MAQTAVAKIVQTIRDTGGLQSKDIANAVNVSPATVSRWLGGQAMPALHTQRIISDLRYVVDRLADFYEPDETRLWLNSRHKLLKNERAIDLIAAGRTEEVLAVIDSLDSGVYL
jgi:transcriptional regulator with XRE-family HTH domain